MSSVQIVDFRALDKVRVLADQLKSVSLRQMKPTLIKIAKVMVEDNRRGILAGLDARGQPAPALTSRTGKGRKPAPRKAGFGKTRGFNPNPVSGKYANATGPRLAPFTIKSRVITNYATQYGQDGTTFFVEGAWIDVLSSKGKPFLHYHFVGAGHNPRYDLRGVRTWGLNEAAKILVADFSALLKKGF